MHVNAPLAVMQEPKPKVNPPNNFMVTPICFPTLKIVVCYTSNISHAFLVLKHSDLTYYIVAGEPPVLGFSSFTEDPARGSVKAFFKALGVLYDDPDRAYSLTYSRETNLRSSPLNNSVLRRQFSLGLSDTIKHSLVHYPEQN